MFEEGLGQDVATGRFDHLLHVGIPIKLGFYGLLNGEFLGDEVVEYLLFSFAELFLLQAGNALEGEIDLVDGDFPGVNLGGNLRCALFLVGFTAGSQDEGSGDQNNGGFQLIHDVGSNS